MAGHLLAGRLTQPGGFPRFDLGSGAQACRGAAGGPGMCGGQRRGGAARSLSLHRRPAAAAAAGPRGDARLPRRPPPSPLPVSGGEAAAGGGARRGTAPGAGSGGGRAGAAPRPPPPPPPGGRSQWSPGEAGGAAPPPRRAPEGRQRQGGQRGRRRAPLQNGISPPLGAAGRGTLRCGKPGAHDGKRLSPRGVGAGREVRPGAVNATADARPSSFKTPFFSAFGRKRGSPNSRHRTASSGRDGNANATKGRHTALPTKDPNPSGCAAFSLGIPERSPKVNDARSQIGPKPAVGLTVKWARGQSGPRYPSLTQAKGNSVPHQHR